MQLAERILDQISRQTLDAETRMDMLAKAKVALKVTGDSGKRLHQQVLDTIRNYEAKDSQARVEEATKKLLAGAEAIIASRD